MKKRSHGSRSWIQIDRNGNSQTLPLDKVTIMRRCHLPARDLRLLDPLFVYPSTILGREKAIVVNLEQIRCIITADEVILMNSLESSVKQYELELCKRLQKDQSVSTDSRTDDLPFEFRALELALELVCTSLDGQVTELEVEVYPVLEELTSSISTLNLEHVRRLKSDLLALTRRVQKVHDEIEQLMDDDGDMAEMYLTEKKERMEAYSSADQYFLSYISTGPEMSKSAPVSPIGSISESLQLDKMTRATSLSKRGSSKGSSNNGEHIEELEMLLEAYFVYIDKTLSKLLSLKEYIDGTEDFINIKLVRTDDKWEMCDRFTEYMHNDLEPYACDNVQNQLIQFELILTAATFVATIFAVVAGVFGMNFTPPFFKHPFNFNRVLIVTGICCALIYVLFMLYFKYRRLLSL